MRRAELKTDQTRDVRVTFLEILQGIFEGFGITASVTACALLYAIPFAFIFGIAQYFSTGARRLAVTSIIEFWRSSPVLILLFFFYYTLPLWGLTLSAMTVGSMVLGLNIGGYASQTVRAALQAVDAGQAEAGIALGLTRRQVLFDIELPQALAIMVPNFVNQLIQLIKGTALVSLITLADMTFRAKEIAQLEYNPTGVYTGLLLSYFVICYPITLIGHRAEKAFGTVKGAGDGL